MSAQFHLNPETYLDEIRAEVPRYDELQEADDRGDPVRARAGCWSWGGHRRDDAAALARYPDAELTGSTPSPEMVFRPRELGIEVRLARMEDPLPDGPWDLVISVLSVHHLTDEQKRDLFRRVREQSRALVIGDVVEGRAAGRAARSPGVDFLDAPPTWPSGAEARSPGRPTTWR